MQSNKNVDAYIEKKAEWQLELQKLREILLSLQLEETVKWGGPCYTYKGKNVVGLGAYKSFVSLWFYQGALLDDKRQVLMNAQEGVTKAMRQWRFDNKADIKSTWIKPYVKQAIANVDAGHEIKANRAKPLTLPSELKRRLKQDKSANEAFKALRKSLQREYADYISAAKRTETRERRLDKIMPMIAAGVGLNDRYRSR